MATSNLDIQSSTSGVEYSDDDIPLAELVRRKVNEHATSSESDDDVPIAELQRKFRRRVQRLMDSENDHNVTTSDRTMSLAAIDKCSSRDSNADHDKVKMLGIVRDIVDKLV